MDPLEALERLAVERGDESVREGLHRAVADGRGRVEAGDEVADGVQQVCLTESGGRVEEQRVVGLAWRFGDREGRRVSEPVAVPDDELIKGVSWNELLLRGL